MKTHKILSAKSAVLACVAMTLLVISFAASTDQERATNDVLDFDGPEMEGASENASNPLAAASNIDIRWQYLDLRDGESSINDVFIDGAFMASSKIKVKYELHYWSTDQSGSTETGLESATGKLIYFARQGITSKGAKYRLAVGFDYIHDLGNGEKGIGLGSDQIGPFTGLALGFNGGTSLIPLIQHFTNINGADISTTAARLILLRPMNRSSWLKADLKVPYDWENDAWPMDLEIQVGKNLNKAGAIYGDVLIGIGGDRLYDWGVGLGFRFNY